MMIGSVVGFLFLVFWVALAALLVGCAIWTRRHLQWSSVVWVCIGLGLYKVTDKLAAWMYDKAIATYQESAPPLWGFNRGESIHLYINLEMLTGAVVMGLLMLLLFGDVVRLAARAGIEADGRCVDTVRKLTRKPAVLGVSALVLPMLHLMWATVMRQHYG